MTTPSFAGAGSRKCMVLGGERYYIIVTVGPNGPHVCCTCPRENAPDNQRLRTVLDAVCREITAMLRAMPKDAE